MINQILAKVQRPEKNWDPISINYGKPYADRAWAEIDPGIIDMIESRIGQLEDKSILDLGGGPGQYTTEFARRGAMVTYSDISKTYTNYFVNRTRDMHFRHEVELFHGYLEETATLNKKFDLVFNRVCWNYSFDDFNFAKIISDLVNEGGHAYLIVDHIDAIRITLPLIRRIQVVFNERFGVKIGHPFPSKRRLQESLARQTWNRIEYDFSAARVFVWLFK